MNDWPSTPPPLHDPDLPRAERRIVVFAITLTVIAAGIGLARWSLAVAGGLLTGGLLSLVNLYWIRRAAEGLVRRAVQSAEAGETPRRSGGTLRALIHFGLLGTLFYAIFISHFLPIAAVLTGFFAVVGGILLEAVWETVQALRRGFPPAQP